VVLVLVVLQMMRVPRRRLPERWHRVRRCRCCVPSWHPECLLLVVVKLGRDHRLLLDSHLPLALPHLELELHLLLLLGVEVLVVYVVLLEVVMLLLVIALPVPLPLEIPFTLALRLLLLLHLAPLLP